MSVLIISYMSTIVLLRIIDVIERFYMYLNILDVYIQLR